MFFFRCFFTCLFFLLNIYLQLEYVHRTENYDKDERHTRPPHHNDDDLEPDEIESEDEGGSDGDSDSEDGDLWDSEEEFEEELGYEPL